MAQAQRQKPPSIEEYWEILHARSEEYERQRQEADLRYEREREEFERKHKENELERDKRWAKLESMFAETDRQFKETKEMFAETDRKFAETDKKFAETYKKVGDLGNSFGELAEHLVAPGMRGRFREIGLVLDKSVRNVEIADENGKTLTEIDLMLENSGCVVAVEVKARVKMGDIDRHKARLEILRLWHGRNGDRRKIMGAIAGAVFGGEERKAAIAEGLYVIVQSGDTMKMDIPEDFEPLVLQA